MGIILFDDKGRDNLLPLTFTRPVADLRVGILTIREKWEYYLDSAVSFLTEEYLQSKFPIRISDSNLLINGAVLPDESLIAEINKMKSDEAIKKGDRLLAVSTSSSEFNLDDPSLLAMAKEYQNDISIIDFPWKIFSLNGQEIEADYRILIKGRVSGNPGKSVNCIHPENIFVEEGFKGEHIVLNASRGPIYLGNDSEIMEGSVIRGPFALCDHSVVKMAAKIYGPTTIGPFCKAGGEINNSVIQGYSNKGHDGFLGNAVIGEWCNIGADSNNSNLKNNYTDVKLWNYTVKRFINTGLQFCGLIMGDHSKCGINTMFNTGTVVGVSANIFGAGYQKNFVPSFTWGGKAIFSLEKAFETMEIVMERRGIKLTEDDRDIFSHIFEETKKYR